MRYMFWIARRQVAANRKIFWLALALGLLPFVLPSLAGLETWPRKSVWTAGAAFCSLVLALSLSTGLGWSLFGNDLAERRFSFYFSRPVSSFAIWSGKCLGAALIILISSAVTFLPVAILSGDAFAAILEWSRALMILLKSPAAGLPELGILPNSAWGWLFPCTVVCACLFLMAFAHAAAILIRSKSGWAVVHLPLLLGALLLASSFLRRITANHATGLLFAFEAGLFLLVTAALWTALAIQICMGRIDMERGHKIYAIVLWPLLFAGLAAAELGSRWLIDVSAADLAGIVSARAPARGSWISICGRARNRGGYSPLFLFDTATGRSLKTGASGGSGWDDELPLISADGTRAVWLSTEDRGRGRSLMMAELSSASARPMSIPIPATESTFLTLSDDGSLLVLLLPNEIAIYALPEGKFVGGTSLRSPGQHPSAVQFLSPDLLRIYIQADVRIQADMRAKPDLQNMEIYEFEIRARRLTKTGELKQPYFVYAASNPAHSELAAWFSRKPGGSLVLCDARTGEFRKLLVEVAQGWAVPHFTCDGRIVVVQTNEGEAGTARIYDLLGNEEHRLDLPGSLIWVGSEYVPGQLPVYVAADWNRDAGSLYSIDLAKGELRRIADRLKPIPSKHFSGRVWSFATGFPGRLQSRLFTSDQHDLVLLDSGSGAARTLIPILPRITQKKGPNF
jgi:hypothetical protein